MTQDRVTIADSVSWLIGKHTLKAGGEYNDTEIEQIFKGNWRGVFIFPTSRRSSTASGSSTGSSAGSRDSPPTRRIFELRPAELALFAQDQWFLSPT